MKNEVRNIIMNAIRNDNVSTNLLARLVNQPEASVRRLIGELRKSGVRITSGYFGYKLMSMPTQTPASELGGGQQATA